MKKLLVVTGGAGFVGSNLIEFLIKKTSYKIISLDNYSSGSKKNHIKSKRVSYINGDINQKFKQFFILVNFQEFIKALFK